MFHLYRLILAVFVLFILPGKLTAESPESLLLFSISNNTKARLGVVNTTKKSLKLEILNSNQNLYFDRALSGNQNFFRMLDLSSMTNGDYIVRLSSGLTELEEKRFRVVDGRASLIKKQKEIAPLFKLVDKNSLIISYLNANSNSVDVFFEVNDEVVFEERGINEMPLSKRYSLANLPKGFYTVKLHSAGLVYTYNISL